MWLCRNSAGHGLGQLPVYDSRWTLSAIMARENWLPTDMDTAGASGLQE